MEGRVLMRSDDAYYRLAGLLLSSTVTGIFTVSFYARHLWRRINPVPVALVIGLVGLLLVYLFRRPIQPGLTFSDVVASVAFQLISYNGISMLYSRSPSRGSSRAIAFTVLLLVPRQAMLAV